MSACGVADHGGLAGRARGRVQPHQLLARHREQAERIGLAQVGLGGERKSPDVVERLQRPGRNAGGIELGPHMRDLCIGEFEL